MIGSIDLKSSKRSRLGVYVCKVGYFDIRQKIVLPNKKIKQGSMQVYVCHGGHQIAGPFKSHYAAKVHAEELMSEGIRYVKYKKGN
jgi:hypothetical protein